MTKDIFLSVIIPVFNETTRIYLLNEILSYFSSQKYSFEIIIVDDGSTDDTLEKLKLYQDQKHLKVISYPKNQGKGYAIKTGMLKADGEFRLFTDVDLSTPISEIEKFLPWFNQFDAVIGTRRSKESKVIVHQSKIREFLGQGFTIMSRTILNTYVSDFTCGFKCFSAKAAEKIFKNLTINRWGFDAEVIFLAKKFGFNIKEIPVIWKNDAETKVKFPQDLINSFSELIIIIINDKIKKIYR